MISALTVDAVWKKVIQMTKQEIIDYMYENHVQGDFKIEEMAEDLAQSEVIRCKDCKYSSPNQVYGCSLEPFDGNKRGFRMYSNDFCSCAELRGDSE